MTSFLKECVGKTYYEGSAWAKRIMKGVLRGQNVLWEGYCAGKTYYAGYF